MISKMTDFIKLKFLVITTISVCSTFFSCKKTADIKEYQAYFGGEVTNPTSQYILFLKDSEVIDSVKLDEKIDFSFLLILLLLVYIVLKVNLNINIFILIKMIV